MPKDGTKPVWKCWSTATKPSFSAVVAFPPYHNESKKILQVSSNESTQEDQVDTASALADGQQSSAFFGDGVT